MTNKTQRVPVMPDVIPDECGIFDRHPVTDEAGLLGQIAQFRIKMVFANSQTNYYSLRKYERLPENFYPCAWLIMKLLFSLIFLSTLLPGLCAVAYPYEVTLEWDKCDALEIMGYRLHYGENSGDYSAQRDVSAEEACFGRTCKATVNVAEGHWYFAVTAYDDLQESGFSNEVDTHVPPSLNLPVLEVKINGEAGPFVVLSGNIEWTLSVAAGDFEGTPYEWWVGARSRHDTIWWLQGSQFPLTDLPETVLLDETFPRGLWYFFVYLDENPNEVMDTPVYQDYIYVLIQ